MLLALDTKLFSNLHNTSMPMLVSLSKMHNPGKKWFATAGLLFCWNVSQVFCLSINLHLASLILLERITSVLSLYPSSSCFPNFVGTYHKCSVSLSIFILLP